jgi:hypothetical protein
VGRDVDEALDEEVAADRRTSERSSKGPVRVSNPAYRDHWDAIFEGGETGEEMVLRSPAIAFVRARPLSSWLGWAAYGFGLSFYALLPALVALAGEKPSGGFAMLLGAIAVAAVSAPLVSLASLVVERFRAPKGGALRLTSDELVVDGGREPQRIAPDEIVHAAPVPGAGLSVGLTRGRRLRVSASPTEAEAFAEALGRAARPQRFHTQFRARALRPLLGVLTFMAALSAIVFPFISMPSATGPSLLERALGSAVAAALSWLWIAATAAPQLEVGSDGIRVHRALRRSRFIAFDAIDRAEPTRAGAGVILRLRDGSAEQVAMPAGWTTGATATHNRAEAEAASLRIMDGIAEVEGGHEVASLLARLDRQGRSVAAWRAHLKAQVERDTDYREALLSRDDLVAILEAPSSRLEHRLAAAIALRSLGEDAPTRIRTTAELCANPTARRVLFGVADGSEDEAALVEALAAEEAHERSHRTASTST